jgi:predicted transcriptional regulator YdeE
MKPEILEKRKITLVGMDFYGNPFQSGEAWSTGNAIGQLWQRFNDFYEKKKGLIKNLASESGYELWIDFEGEEDNKYIFVGVEVGKLAEPPLELVARILPETRYAVYTLKGDDIKSDWPSKLLNWVSEAGLEQSYTYIIEYYDPARFKGMDNSDSELDIYVPVR